MTRFDIKVSKSCVQVSGTLFTSPTSWVGRAVEHYWATTSNTALFCLSTKACKSSVLLPTTTAASGMDLQVVLNSYRHYVGGRDSATAYAAHGAAERAAMAFARVTALHPFYPLPGWQEHALPTQTHVGFTCAYRDPVALARAWYYALWRSRRVPTPDMENSRLIVRADGIADKPFTYHVGIVYAEDTRKMSAFSQRDFIVGVLPEKNQFAMILCARQIGQLAVAMRNSAVAVYMNMDMAALKNLSRGVCEQPGGFAIKDFNASVCAQLPRLPNPPLTLHLDMAGNTSRLSALRGWQALLRLVSLKPQRKDSAYGTRRAPRRTGNTTSC